MGIRIHKKIGYFLSNQEAKALFVKNYPEVLENLENDDAFFSHLFEEMKNYKKDKTSEILFSSVYLLEYQKAVKEKKLEAYQLISQLFFYDTAKGVLISTNEQVKKSRYDDLIDYYENATKDKIQYLNRPIYPLSGYVYQGGLKNKLVKGETVDGVLASILIKSKEEKKPSNIQTEANKIVNSGFFTPHIDPICFMIAKCAKILKKEVSVEEFNKTIKPVIITTWG